MVLRMSDRMKEHRELEVIRFYEIYRGNMRRAEIIKQEMVYLLGEVGVFNRDAFDITT